MDQEEFNRYMRQLPYEQLCKLMKTSVVPLCTFSGNCPYQGKETYTYKGSKLCECKREEILHYKRILGVPQEKPLHKFT